MRTDSGMQMTVIGIAGDKGAGKDSIAAVLEEEFGFESLAPGDLIRRVIHDVSGIPIEEMTNRETKERTRKVQQDVGFLMRDIFGKDVWINRVFSLAQRYEFNRLVIPSVRGEESIVQANGGQMWFVSRPGLVKDVNDGHAIEQFAANANPADYDVHIINDGTLDDLKQKVYEVLRERGIDPI